jgi:hypothetical protein
MKHKTLKKAKRYWGLAIGAREKLEIARAAGHKTARLTELAEKYEAYSRSLFASLPSSKTKALNSAKSKAESASREKAREQAKHGAFGPPPANNWVIAPKEY